MSDIEILLNSLVNIDRNSLVAILHSEAEAAHRLVDTARRRTPSQRARRQAAEHRAARIDRILSFFQHGDIAPDMSEHDVELCTSVDQKLRVSGPGKLGVGTA